MPDLPPIDAESTDMRLDRYLRQQFPDHSLGMINRALRQRQVRINSKRIKGDARIQLGDVIYVPKFFLDQPQKPSPEMRGVDPKLAEKLRAMVVDVTEDYIVLNKPQGLAVQGGSGTKWHLDRMLPSLAVLYDDPADHLRIVHRLDKETSGLMLIARGRKAAQKLAKQFENRQIHKYYLALCHNSPIDPEGRITAALGKGADHRYSPNGESPRPAESDYIMFDQVLKTAATLTLSPITGRTHQLRAHLSLIECPIIGDTLYGAEPNDYITKSPMCLHAMALSIPAQNATPQKQYFQAPSNWVYSKAKDIGLTIPTENQLWASWS